MTANEYDLSKLPSGPVTGRTTSLRASADAHPVTRLVNRSDSSLQNCRILRGALPHNYQSGALRTWADQGGPALRARLCKLAERLKLSATLRFSSGGNARSATVMTRALTAAALLGFAVCTCYAPAADAQTSRNATAQAHNAQPRKVQSGTTYSTPEAAYNFGLSALQSGHPEMAIKAFEFIAQNGDMQSDFYVLAHFYLARIYSDNTLAYTNHARAFELYQHIATEFTGLDVDDDLRAPFVAKSMTALASYYRSGIPAAGVAVNLEQSAALLREAAMSFRDEDAQFEFAKILLKGEGVGVNPREALYWLRNLSTLGHASAQAFLADLYWRGNHVPKDPLQAYLLIDVALMNAPAADRVWIEDTFQFIFCGAGEGVRQEAKVAVADWRSKFGRRTEDRVGRDGLAVIQPRAIRTCSNGEPAMPSRRGDVTAEPMKPSAGAAGYVANPRSAGGSSAGFGPGNANGFTLRDAGQSTLVPAR
jgi:uncharacterized protein